MTELLYLNDHYLREFEATILGIPSLNEIVLDRTAIYPRGGGQPSDTGTIRADGAILDVKESIKDTSRNIVTHQISRELTLEERNRFLGLKVKGIVNWELRYKHMRHHTALHILSGIVYHEFRSRITGGQIYPDRARLDFTLSNLGKENLDLIERESNRIVEEDHEVRAFWVDRETALKQSDLYRLSADLLPKDLDKLRIVEIVGFDAQLDGGTHVARTSEIGNKIKITKTENKGKDNKRIEIQLE